MYSGKVDLKQATFAFNEFRSTIECLIQVLTVNQTIKPVMTGKTVWPVSRAPPFTYNPLSISIHYEKRLTLPRWIIDSIRTKSKFWWIVVRETSVNTSQFAGTPNRFHHVLATVRSLLLNRRQWGTFWIHLINLKSIESTGWAFRSTNKYSDWLSIDAVTTQHLQCSLMLRSIN